MPRESPSKLPRALVAGAPRPLLSKKAEAALGVRHREVLTSLEQLLRDGELGALTIADIAARLGCSRRTLYELAPSKDNLILLVVDRVMHRVGEAAIAAIDPDAPVAVQLRQYLASSPDYTFGAAAIDDILESPAARRVRDTHHRFASTVLERLLAMGVDRGEFRRVDPAVAAAVITAASAHLALPEILDDLDMPHDHAMADLLDLALHGLLAPPTS